MEKRVLGRSGIKVSAVGMGCWAIGGPWDFLGNPAGWSQVDDAESIRAIHAALDNGVDFFDTAANYGCGHSERILGQALAGKRDQAVIATKFGYRVDEKEKNVWTYGDEAAGPVAEHIREDLQASLARLGMDYVDVFQLHIWGYKLERALEVRQVLEDLAAEGLIRCYGWSTDRPEAVELFAEGKHCSVVQQQLNIFDGVAEILDQCEKYDLASINRGPLGMGILTGKFTAQSTFPQDDVRKHAEWFPGLVNGSPNPEWLAAIEAIREILTSGGRTLAQGALAWILARSERTVPIPGFKTTKQVVENAGVLEHGPLNAEEMKQIESILADMGS